MTIIAFPSVEDADEDGFLCIGGDLEVESLLLAYSSGIFPWPIREGMLTWFAPPRRAVLFLSEFRVSRTLKKDLKNHPFEIRIDHAFAEVIKRCAESTNRGKQKGTWITRAMVKGYTALHKAGYAHSVESYLNGDLVGGLYGVQIGKMFAGESMFFREPNASKIALCALVDNLKAQGVEWIDCQVMNPLFESFGAREVARVEFMKMLRKAIGAAP